MNHQEQENQEKSSMSMANLCSHNGVSPNSKDSRQNHNGNDKRADCLNFFPLPWNNLGRYSNVRRQGFNQKYFACELLKMEGNNHYNQQQHQKALESYLHALSIFLKSTDGLIHIINDTSNHKTPGKHNFHRKLRLKP